MWLRKFLSFHWRFPLVGIVASLVFSFAGIWLSLDLGLDTDIKSLLPQQSESVQNLNALEPKAGSSNYFLVTLWGGPLEDRVKAARALSRDLLEAPDLARSVRYQTPKAFFEDKKFVLIPTPTLERILNRLQRERREHSEFTDPFGLERRDSGSQAEAPPVSPEEEEAESEDLDRAKSLMRSLDEMRPYYSSKDGKFLSLVVIPNADSFSISKNRELIAQVDELLENFEFSSFHPEIQAAAHGSLHRQIDKFESIQRDLSSGTWVFFAIILIISLYFRSLWANLMILPPLIVGMASGYGLVSQLEGSLNTIAVFLVLIVFGVGIDFGAHLLARYLQERKKFNPQESILTTWQTTGRATVTSAVALVAGFGILAVSSFEGFSQFGRVAVVLLSLTAISFLLLMPSWIFLCEKLRRESAWPNSLSDIFWNRGQSWFRPQIARYARRLRQATLVLAPICLLAGAAFVRFDYAFEEGSSSVQRLPKEYQGDSFSERLKPSAIAVFKGEETAAHFVEKFQIEASNYPDIALVNGLASVFPPDQETRIDLLQQIADEIEPSLIQRFEDEEVQEVLLEIEEKAYDLFPYSLDEVPPDLQEPFFASGSSGEQLVYIFDVGGPTDGRKAIRFSEAVEQFLEDFQFDPLYAGHEILFADIVTRVTTEGPLLVLGMLLLVFLVCFSDFRSLKPALIVMSPVVLGFLFTGLLLSIFDIQLNFFNMAALASLGSLVVDNSIHLYHRYLGLVNVGHPRAAWGATLAIGPTVTACTLTSTSAYWALLMADHNGISSLGAVAVIGLLCCLVSAVIFFPAWLMARDELRELDQQKVG
ncbi:MAG: hypothetical protein EA369_05130 [Bradymonadales bacterium]|nr:MAG: hypothetical protein EA369_05130 [Bradymonadales bacterium]